MKVDYIISNVHKAVAFEWIVDALADDFDFHFILLAKDKNTPLSHFLESRGVSNEFIALGSKSSWPIVWLKILFSLMKRRAEVVHTHLFEASLLGLSAAKMAGIKQRIHTRHHSTYHHKYFPKAVKYDRLINGFSTDIIAISKNVESILKDLEEVDGSKIHLIYHGFDLERFRIIDSHKLELLRKKYQVPQDRFIIGCISRYVEWKGVQFLLDALIRLKKQGVKFFLILANAGGPYEHEIRKKLNLLDENDFLEIGFENDLFSLYHLFDLYVHLPIDIEFEAFGQTYVEALAAGIPSIFTLSGVANEFVENGQHAVVVKHQESNELSEIILRMMKDETFRKQYTRLPLDELSEFSLEKFVARLKKLYSAN